MAKTKTNLNIMTSLLITALNNKKSNFRDTMITLFSKSLNKYIPSNTIFYDGTHQALLYEEMDNNEVDVIARVPGKRTPVLMIEIKVGIREELQESQREGGAYQRTAENHGIPLLYIIPKNYNYQENIPSYAKKINWEEIIKKAREKDYTYLAEQIENFVELSEETEALSKEEVILLTMQSLLREVIETKDKVFEKIEEILLKEYDKFEENPYGAGYYYNGEKFFIGFNPCYNDKDFFALCIKEDSSTDKDDKLYYEDGYYFVPVQECECLEGDKKLLKNLRKALTENEIIISDTFKRSLYAFYTLKEKIKKLINDYVKNNKKSDLYDMDDGIGISFEDGNILFLFNYTIKDFTMEIHKDFADSKKCKDLEKDEVEMEFEKDKDNDFDYYYLPLRKLNKSFGDFLLSSTGEELQKNFNILVNAAKKEIKKYRK